MKNKVSRTIVNQTLLVLLALLFLAFALWAQEAQQAKDQPPAKGGATENKIPPDAGAKANPVKPTPESLAKAKKLYAIDCAMCHGKDGDGKGDMASDMKNVTDFTAPDALKNRTDGELFYVLRKGKGEMPPEGDRAKDDDVWGLVNYVRSLAKK